MRKLNIEDLKKEFVGKTFNWLTVLDVFMDDHTTIMFKCQCRCGTIADVRKQYVLSDHTTSCGCYKCSHEKGDTILTMCPNCNKYDKHTLSNVYHISYGRLKLDHAPLCSTCRNKLISSSYEQEIADYISTFYSGELIRNSRNIISPLELDLYYPEKKIAIEFNGDYWHDENHKPRDYHYNKFNLCREKNILLVSIFESEWNNRKEDIKQYLLDLFSNIENSISFNDEHTMMNNNYPSINHYLVTESCVDHIYYNGHFNVYTCGYSKIL